MRELFCCGVSMNTANGSCVAAQENRARIDVGDAHELRYWAHRFDCSRAEIIRAENQVGPNAFEVERCVRHVGAKIKLQGI